MRIIATGLLAIALSTSSLASTAEGHLADIGGTTVSLVPPDGWCRLESEKISDARLVGILRDGMEQVGNVFVVAYADCGELERWRLARQRTLDNYCIVAYNNGYRDFEYRGTNTSFVSEVREMMEAVSHKDIEDLMEQGAKVIEDAVPTVKMDKPISLGILGEDESSLYVGMIMSMVTEYGDSKVSVFSNGLTLLQSKFVFTYLYTDYEDAAVIPHLLRDHKKWTARLRAAN